MPTALEANILETTIHDMKTHFSQYASQLCDGTYDEIIVKNRSTPTLRILPYEGPKNGGLRLGVARELGHPSVDHDLFDALDTEVAEMFEEYM